MRQSWLHPNAETRPTATKGIGVFAVAPIPANTTVAGFGGRVVDGKELASLGEAVRIHALQIDDDLFLASTPPFDPADYVNHSCDPNCGIVGSVLLVTMRDVAAGEELCFDYAMTDSDDYDMFGCDCGTRSVPRRRHRRRLEAARAARPLRRAGSRRTSHAGFVARRSTTGRVTVRLQSARTGRRGRGGGARSESPRAGARLVDRDRDRSFDRGRGREVLDAAAVRAHEMVVVAGQVLGELVAREVGVGHEPVHDAGLFEHDEVAVRASSARGRAARRGSRGW